MDVISAECPQRVIDDLRRRLAEAEETLRAIHFHEVDALVVSMPVGDRVYTLQSAEQPYRRLVEQMPEGALTVSGEGIILYCNQRFAEMVRTPHQNVIAAPIRTFVSSTDMPAIDALLESGRERVTREEALLCAGDGVMIPVQFAVSPLEEQGDGHVCVIVTDLTEHRQHQRTKRLSEELTQKQAHIEELNERLQRAMTETHHRVKNNLQVIAAMVDMLLMERGATVPASELRRIGEHTRALAVVHDILTASAKDTGRVHMITAGDVLDRLLPLLKLTAGERPIDVDLQDLSLPGRQATSLAMVLTELVGNAVKHGQGRVQVLVRTENDTAIVEVCDDGPGFPPDFDSKTAANTGLELVLNLASWDLAGSVEFVNLPRGGACVRLRIPLPSGSSQ